MFTLTKSKNSHFVPKTTNFDPKVQLKRDTVWKIENFSTTHILCEINSTEFRTTIIAILTFLGLAIFVFSEF